MPRTTQCAAALLSLSLIAAAQYPQPKILLPKKEKEPETPLVLNDNPATHVNGSSNNFPDVCYEYVPSEADGDELKWKSFTEPEVMYAK